MEQKPDNRLGVSHTAKHNAHVRARQQAQQGTEGADGNQRPLSPMQAKFVYFYRLFPGNARKAAAWAGYYDPTEAAKRLVEEPRIKELLAAGLGEDLADDPDLPKKALGRVAAIALRPEDNALTLKACGMLLQHFRILYGQERTGGDQILNMFTSPEQAREILARLPERLSTQQLLERDSIPAEIVNVEEERVMAEIGSDGNSG